MAGLLRPIPAVSVGPMTPYPWAHGAVSMDCCQLYVLAMQRYEPLDDRELY